MNIYRNKLLELLLIEKLYYLSFDNISNNDFLINLYKEILIIQKSVNDMTDIEIILQLKSREIN